MTGPHIHLFDVVLFLHIAVAVGTFACAGLALTSLFQMRAAGDIGVLRSWARVSHRVEPLFPILVLVLIVLGGSLIQLSKHSDESFSFTDGWVITAVTALVLMEAYGGAVLAPAGRRLHELVESAEPGPVPLAVRSAVMNKAVWAGAFGNTGTALGILFLMPTKPSGVYAVAIVAAAAGVSVSLGLRLATSGLRAGVPVGATVG